jgi:hypothetical protein
MNKVDGDSVESNKTKVYDSIHVYEDILRAKLAEYLISSRYPCVKFSPAAPMSEVVFTGATFDAYKRCLFRVK